MELEVKVESFDNISVIKPVGRIDPMTVDEFERAIRDSIMRGQIRIVVDASGINYISSAGLGVLMGYIEEVREKGGDIVLCSVPKKIYEIFDLLGFTKIYRFFPSLEEAINYFRSNG